MEWIELITTMECNCHCRACPGSRLSHTDEMTGKELASWLDWGRQQGATGVWFGGGEPTLHPDLVRSIRYARKAGYMGVRVQTNGLRLAHQAFSLALLDAGANQIALSIKGGNADQHDTATRNPRSFELLLRGLEVLRRSEVRIEGDVLVTKDNQASLAEIVVRFQELGVARFNFWLVSGHGLPSAEAGALVPRLSELSPHLQAAFQSANRLGVEAVSLHTPPCVLPAKWRSRYQHSGRWDLVVVPPAGQPFKAETSPMEGGAFPTGCKGCSLCADCLGPRADYLELYGGSEFVALRSSAKGSKVYRPGQDKE